MPRFSLETALKVRDRLEKLYQKALAEQVQVEKQHRDIRNGVHRVKGQQEDRRKHPQLVPNRRNPFCCVFRCLVRAQMYRLTRV